MEKFEHIQTFCAILNLSCMSLGAYVAVKMQDEIRSLKKRVDQIQQEDDDPMLHSERNLNTRLQNLQSMRFSPPLSQVKKNEEK